MTQQEKQKRSYYLWGLMVAVVITGVVAFSLSYGVVWAVTVNEKAVAYAKSKDEAQETLEKLLNQKSEDLGQEVKIESNVEFEKIRDSSVSYDSEKLAEKLNEELNFVTEGAVIKIDGTSQFKFKDKNSAREFINRLKNKYHTGKNYKVSFGEKIEIVNQRVNLDNLNTIEEALRLTEEGEEQIEVYIVQENDTLWEIAEANNTSVDNLKDLNPEIGDNLQPGDEIKVSGSGPLLTVITNYEITKQENISFNTQYRKDYSLPAETRKVIKQGKEGLKKVTYQVKAKNGKVIEKTVLNEKNIEKSEPRIIKKGARLAYSSRGSKMTWPASGRVSSRFGPRWGEMHKGIDIAANYGAPVRAAAPGRVASAYRHGGYGQLVVIYHGNGVTTRYAHLSSIEVKVGQTVSQGQFIGRAGTSGRTTGPNLHFEVLKNGNQVNPLNYL